MKNEQTITGTLRIVEALPNSYYGNPRYLVAIGDDEYRTLHNSMLACYITKFDRKRVQAIVGTHYSKPTVRAVESF